MNQFLIRWSGNVCKVSLPTILFGLVVGLLMFPTDQCLASDTQVKNMGNDIQQSQDSDLTSHPNEIASNAEPIPNQSVAGSAETFDDKLLIPQTDSSPNVPEKIPSPKETVQDTKQNVQKSQETIEDQQKDLKSAKDKKKINKKKSAAKKKPKKEVVSVRGKAFVDSITTPLSYELNERFWGWRPNDIINVTDNVNNLQLGILEVSRRAVVVLALRISRTGSNDMMDENIENAMNWLMVKARQYWFPSPESKYNQAIDELNQYVDRLKRGRASFYIRTDNLIPLLEQFEDLLGGCDKSLTIKEDADGPIGSSKADNYFYYAQGVALAMGNIYRGVRKDFYVTLESVQGTQILDEAIEACDNAKDIAPWIVTEGSLSSIWANHRANIDQPINRIRFYTNVLIKTLKGY